MKFKLIWRWINYLYTERKNLFMLDGFDFIYTGGKEIGLICYFYSLALGEFVLTNKGGGFVCTFY